MKLYFKLSFFILALILKSNDAFCQSGNLDSTYHFDGIAMPAYWQTSGDTRGQKVAIQSDGKAVVVGYHKNTNYDFALIRYNIDGTMDSTFGGDGLVTSSLFGSDDYAYALAIQPDGKIVAAGYSYHTSYSQKVFSVARYNTDGTLDATFGAGGKAFANFGSGDQNAYGVALQADGKIVLAGTGLFNPTPIDSRFCVARFTTTGSLDNTFSGNGLWNSSFGTGNDGVAYDVDIQSNQRIVVSGTVQTSGGSFMTVVRLDATGNYDNTFDGDGLLQTQINGISTSGNNLILQNDGKMVIVGGSNNLMGVKRLNADGSADSTFSQDGSVLIDFGSTSNNGYSIALASNQRIIVAGSTLIGSTYDHAIARLTPQGELDLTFNGDGKVIVSYTTQDEIIFGLAIQNDNKIIATGFRGSGLNGSLSTIRLNACVNTFSTEAIDECLSYFWPQTGQTYTSSGVYFASYLNAGGCDSTVILNLNIYQNPNVNVTQNGVTLTAVQTGATYQWLDCNNNNNPISGATNQTYVASVNGSYSCAVTLNGCTDFSSCSTIATVGINDHFNNNTFNTVLFPNPTNGIVNVQSDIMFERLLVADLSGRILISRGFLNDAYVDMSDFENGVYIVTMITNEGDQRNFKIIKK
ncbi:MAG: T9SS type A sorting domain-containing protein [Bacteroidota bacterium]